MALNAIMVVWVGMKWAHLPAESTVHMMALYPLDSGSSMMKSMLTVSQQLVGISSG